MITGSPDKTFTSEPAANMSTVLYSRTTRWTNVSTVYVHRLVRPYNRVDISLHERNSLNECRTI